MAKQSILRFKVPVSFDVPAGNTERVEQKLDELRKIGDVDEEHLTAKSVRVEKSTAQPA